MNFNDCVCIECVCVHALYERAIGAHVSLVVCAYKRLFANARRFKVPVYTSIGLIRTGYDYFALKWLYCKRSWCLLCAL